MEKQIKKLVELAKEWVEFCKEKGIKNKDSDGMWISRGDGYSHISFDWPKASAISITIHSHVNKHSVGAYSESLTPENLTRIITTYSSKLDRLRKEEVAA